MWEAFVAAPPEGEGWVAFVIELIFKQSANGSKFRVSTAVSILPQTFPYDDCFAESCSGPFV